MSMKKVIMKVSIAALCWSYYPGQEATLEDELAEAWHNCGHCKIVGDAEESAEQTHIDNPIVIDNLAKPAPVELKHLGGGYYQLSNGEKVKGKDVALEAQKVLEAGENNGTKPEDTTTDGTGELSGDQDPSQA